MAILATVSQEGGQTKFYEVPDDELQKYELETERKDDAGGETPEGTMPAGLMSGGSGLQANGTICYVRRGRRIWWWYC